MAQNSTFTKKEGYGIISRGCELNATQQVALANKVATLDFIIENLEKQSPESTIENGTGKGMTALQAHNDLVDLKNFLSHLLPEEYEVDDLFIPVNNTSAPAF